jgi:hypothetical protein
MPKKVNLTNLEYISMRKTFILLFASLVPVFASGGEPTETSVDAILSSAWIESNIQPAPICSDEQFLRRITLDLAGRIPTVEEREAFLANPDRQAAVELLLSSSEFPLFWGELWTTQLFGYEDNNADRETLAQWLQEQFRTNRPYDQIVEELLTSTGESAFDGPVNFLLRYPDEPVVKVSRAFLGVRLDCARCHDHPFDRWTQTDFQRMNRFFSAMERQDVSASNVRLVDVVRDVSPEERPRFLTGAEPRTTQWRAEFALFLTRSRPFARNFANRLWYHFLGRGIVHPVDDVNSTNPASVPALLEALADETRAQNFDVRQMIRLICSSQAYQRESSGSKNDQTRQQLFAVRTIKPLTPEQWYESMCIATGRPSKASERDELVRVFLGDDLNSDYSATWDYRETVQGLMSRLVAPVKPPSRTIEELFVRFLGRMPTSAELEKCSDRSLDEVSFALLHSSEFAFNY